MLKTTNSPESIRRIATQFEPFIDRVPYAMASLPPNLFDHTESRQPYIPQDDLEAARLATFCEYYSKHLEKNLANWPITHQHGTIGSIKASTIWSELVRLRTIGKDPFQSSEGMDYWHQYRRVYLRQLRQSRSDLLYNATFVSYPKNRRFSEVSGYFEKATQQAEYFCLLNVQTNNIFTTHVRTPIGRYGTHMAANLTKAAATMVTLIARSEPFIKEAVRLSEDTNTRQLLDHHLLRASDSGLDYHRVFDGILHTALEGCISTATLLGLLTMDEIPGHPFPGDALAAVADARLPSKVTALAPLGVAAPTGLHGRYFSDMVIRNQTDALMINPTVAQSLKEMSDARLPMHYQAWSEYLASPQKAAPPVRTGLRCPFKGDAVAQFSDALVLLYSTIVGRI